MGNNEIITNLTQTELNDILSKGGELDLTNVGKKILRNYGFEEVKDSSCIRMILSQVVANAQHQAYQASIDRIKEKTPNLYRVILKPGQEMSEVKNKPGLYWGNVREKGVIKDWTPLEKFELDGVDVPNIAGAINLVFEVMAEATSQYYLVQINKNLKSIRSDVDEIKGYMEDGQLSKVDMLLITLSERVDECKLSLNSEEQRLFYKGEFAGIKKDATERITFYRRQYDRYIKGKKTNECDEDKARITLTSLGLCTYVYNMAYFMETVLTSKLSDTELKRRYKKMNEYLNDFYDKFDNVGDKIFYGYIR